jgi:hypothetical protein
MLSTVLREVLQTEIDAFQLQAARGARHLAYRSDALDSHDSANLTRVLSRGALRPASEAKRFEIAVLLALIEGIEARLRQGNGWEATRAVVAANRQGSSPSRGRTAGASTSITIRQSCPPRARSAQGTAALAIISPPPGACDRTSPCACKARAAR